jgi:HEAT repeat protein
VHAPEVDDLLRELRNPDPKVRSAAAGALGALGADGIPAIEPLYEVCSDPNMYVRGEALHSLWEIACASSDADAWPLLVAGVPTLIALLDDPWWSVRCSAMTLLAEIGPEAEAALPRLRALLTNEPPGLTEHPEGWGLETAIRLVREGATEAIEAIGNGAAGNESTGDK